MANLKENEFPLRVLRSAERVAGRILFDVASDTRHVQAVRAAFRDPGADRLVARAARALLAVRGDAVLEASDEGLDVEVAAILRRLFVPEVDPSDGDVVRVLEHLDKQGEGAATVSVVLEQLNEKLKAVEVDDALVR